MTSMADRINRELKAVGVGVYGRWLHPARQLGSILREDEHIEAAVFGLSAQGAAMLVGTDKRVIFVEGNMLYNAMDDFGYNVVEGVNSQSTVLYESVTLHTKMHTYTLTYVASRSAQRFVTYIEDRVEHAGELQKDLDFSYEHERPEQQNQADDAPSEQPDQKQYVQITGTALEFIKSHQLMVVSTTSRTGQVYSAVVYYILVEGVLYMLTKKETLKSHNLMAMHAAAITIYDATTRQTVQMQADAEVVGDPQLRQMIFTVISNVMNDGVESLPIAQLDAGGYIVYALRPTDLQYHDFGLKKPVE